MLYIGFVENINFYQILEIVEGTYCNKNRRRSSNENIKNRLYMWFLQQQATGNPLTDLLLQEKAMEICGQHGSTSFAASRGWLRNFKKRYAIRFREKKVSIDKESTNS